MSELPNPSLLRTVASNKFLGSIAGLADKLLDLSKEFDARGEKIRSIAPRVGAFAMMSPLIPIVGGAGAADKIYHWLATSEPGQAPKPKTT